MHGMQDNKRKDRWEQWVSCSLVPVADPGFVKGGFMSMCTVATTPPFDAHVHRCNESGAAV